MEYFRAACRAPRATPRRPSPSSPRTPRRARCRRRASRALIDQVPTSSGRCSTPSPRRPREAAPVAQGARAPRPARRPARAAVPGARPAPERHARRPSWRCATARGARRDRRRAGDAPRRRSRARRGRRPGAACGTCTAAPCSRTSCPPRPRPREASRRSPDRAPGPTSTRAPTRSSPSSPTAARCACPYCSNPRELVARRRRAVDRRVAARLDEAAALGRDADAPDAAASRWRARDLEAIAAHARALGTSTSTSSPAASRSTRARSSAWRRRIDHVQLSVQDATARGGRSHRGLRRLRRTRCASRAGSRRSGCRSRSTWSFTARTSTASTRSSRMAERLGADRLELANVQFVAWALENARRAPAHARRRSNARAPWPPPPRERLAGRIEVVFVLPDWHADRPRPAWTAGDAASSSSRPTARCCRATRRVRLPPRVRERARRGSLAQIWRDGRGHERVPRRRLDARAVPSCDRREVDYGGCRCQAFALTGRRLGDGPGVCRSRRATDSSSRPAPWPRKKGDPSRCGSTGAVARRVMCAGQRCRGVRSAPRACRSACAGRRCGRSACRSACVMGKMRLIRVQKRLCRAQMRLIRVQKRLCRGKMRLIRVQKRLCRAKMRLIRVQKRLYRAQMRLIRVQKRLYRAQMRLIRVSGSRARGRTPLACLPPRPCYNPPHRSLRQHHRSPPLGAATPSSASTGAASRSTTSPRRS